MHFEAPYSPRRLGRKIGEEASIPARRPQSAFSPSDATPACGLESQLSAAVAYRVSCWNALAAVSRFRAFLLARHGPAAAAEVTTVVTAACPHFAAGPAALVYFFTRPAGPALVSAYWGRSPSIERQHQASSATGIPTFGTNCIAPGLFPNANTSDIATIGSNEGPRGLGRPHRHTARHSADPRG